MDVATKIYNPTPGSSSGVDQESYIEKGNAWIKQEYPDINFIVAASIRSWAAVRRPRRDDDDDDDDDDDVVDDHDDDHDHDDDDGELRLHTTIDAVVALYDLNSHPHASRDTPVPGTVRSRILSRHQALA
jgi:hypothetical protein